MKRHDLLRALIADEATARECSLGGGWRSEAPEGEEADYSLPRLADDMFDLIEDAGVDQVHWLGNSLGGIVGLAMLAR
jgi:pimeloyl-ACP methyl ester carboxylesterase